MRYAVCGLVGALVMAASAFAGPAATVQRGMLTVELAANKEAYAVGEPVELTLTLSNRGTGPLVFQFNDGQRYDFVATGEDGTVVWVWSRDKAFIQVLGTLTITPGESRVYRDRWDQKDDRGVQVRPGRYVIEGVFPPRRLAGTQPDRPAADNPRVTITIGGPSGGTVPRLAVDSRAVDGGQVGEVVINGRAVLRIRAAAGGLGAVRRAEIVVGRLRALIAQGLRSGDLGVTDVGGEVAIVAHGQVVVTVDRNHARLNNTTPRALAVLWLRALAQALSP
ncbi:MAG: BsuPI-related putative proteinase inhibitor [Armatimonadota bacterium]|nr:BsuPI-related putative proteinase inhibitor [Armatimonadota bacterium]MDR5697354.1 BsuPI-related putative proteinase inhibitor [Armatimonadota bacterium]